MADYKSSFKLTEAITANCEVGTFTTFYGESLKFVGRNGDGYEVLRGREVLDGTSASGLAYDIDQFSALCPGRKLEADFISVVETARSQYRSAINDLVRPAARPARAKALCRLTALTVDNWVGTVSTLSSSYAGRGILSIKVGEEIYLTTWNNEYSDSQDHTLLDPNADVFRQAATLRVGQQVIFSGAFRPSPADCIREASVTLDGSLTEPEFIVRFSRLEPASLR